MERLTMIDGCGNDELARCMDCGLEKAGADLENCGMCEEGWQRALKRLAAYEDLMERWKLRSIEEADRIFQRVNALGGTDLMAQYRAIGSIDHLRDLLQAEQDGRLLELPFVAMVEQSLQDGKMKPLGDQKHNGRYAVVYVDRNKWKSPLIDICGKPYLREEAEARMAVLAQKGGEG